MKKRLLKSVGKSGREYLYFVREYGSFYEIGIYSVKRNAFGVRRLLNRGFHARYNLYDLRTNIAEMVSEAVEEVDEYFRRLDDIERHYEEVSE